ncbi:tRNA uridine-5-carboxymethylaminomethyl(34) synthesis GTPase MnmE [bacterium]|nr:tRNA uridine-5-carboxymethylaminomethyl(34) synthesis GTPase MnmE [bacterium]
MTLSQNDTIAAVATPPGQGGIAVIRISGPHARACIQSVFFPSTAEKKPATHRAEHGWIRDNGEPIDEVLVTWFQAPSSYTGEDVVEISCHGGTYVAGRILDLIIRQGTRPARPGEFTERAFLNGKMDLSQAEAVADLIHARTEAARVVAAYQLEGRLSDEIARMRELLTETCGLLELELDFCEEDVKFSSRDEMDRRLQTLQSRLESLLGSFARGRICREGIRLVIIGRPNVGKSSLLNRLIEKERAIVTDVPGTTRDTLEEMLDVEGVLFIVTDTAGVRETREPVEMEGVRRTRQAMDSADMILWVLDNHESWHPEDAVLMQKLQELKVPGFCVINKCDLKTRLQAEPAGQHLPEWPVLSVSARTGAGLDRLIQALKNRALSGDLPGEGELLITKARHADAIRSCLNHLDNARKTAEQGLSQEFIALDLRGALDALGRITGQVTSDDILNRIFSDFCIGK